MPFLASCLPLLDHGGYERSIFSRFFGSCSFYGGSIINRFFNVFLSITVTHLLYRFLKDMKSLWLLFFSVAVFFFIFRESAIRKKYTNTNGKDSKYTNTIDISIIWSCSMGKGTRRRVTCRRGGKRCRRRGRKHRVTHKTRSRKLVNF